MYNATIAAVLVTLPRTAHRKFPHQKHLVMVIDHTPTIVTTTGTDHTHSIMDTGKGTPLTGQDHTIDLNMTEVPVTTGEMHPTLYHATAVAHNIHLQTDTPEGTLAGTSHTVTDVI